MSDNYDLPASFYPPEPATAVGTYDAPVQSGPQDGQEGKADLAKEQASQLKDQAVESGSNVVGAAKDGASDVVGEAKTQFKDLLSQTQNELKDQAATQQKRAASGLHSLADELGDMARSSQSGGVASDLVGQAAARADGVASWLDNRDPGSLLHEVRAYAARKPGTFIAIAALAGLAAGRLTKNLVGAAADKKAEAEAEANNQDVYLSNGLGDGTISEPQYGERA